MRIQENHPHHRDGIHLSVGLKPTAHSALPFDTPAGTSRSFPTPPQPMSEGRTSGRTAKRFDTEKTNSTIVATVVTVEIVATVVHVAVVINVAEPYAIGDLTICT